MYITFCSNSYQFWTIELFRRADWRRTSFRLTEGPAPGPPASSRRSSGGPARSGTSVRAACPAGGWSSAASSGPRRCRSRGHAGRRWSSSGAAPPCGAPSSRGGLQEKVGLRVCYHIGMIISLSANKSTLSVKCIELGIDRIEMPKGVWRINSLYGEISLKMAWQWASGHQVPLLWVEPDTPSGSTQSRPHLTFCKVQSYIFSICHFHIWRSKYF